VPTPILGPPEATVAQAEAWASDRQASEEFVSLAALYWDLAEDHGTVRPEVAFAQAAKETSFGRFGGVVDASFHNPCGLKTTAGGSNSDPNAHQRFTSWREGVTAHLDHLALYAGADGYPRAPEATPDPRHFPFLAGKAKSVEALGGSWAPSEVYGQSIVADYLTGLLATRV
jgi:N-acetylmuramoyl-L-alanine amidase